MLVKFNATRLLGFQGKFIIPGINDLTTEMVMDMQDDSVLAAKFDSGELQMIDRESIGATQIKKKKGEAITGIDVLLNANEKHAAKLAKETVSMEILQVWVKKEKRPAVKKLVQGQIDKIKNIEYRDEKKTKLERAALDEE